MALLALLVPAAAQASPGAVIRDCREDGDLDHKYSNADLRKAEDNLPADVDEYTDCREVIAGAVTSGTNKTSGSGGGNDDGGAAGATSGGAAASQKEQKAQADDKAALGNVTKHEKKPQLDVGGQSVEPGDNGLLNVASESNGLPLPLLLALIAAVLLAVGGGLVALRRRIPALQRIPLLSKISLPRVPTPRARD